MIESAVTITEQQGPKLQQERTCSNATAIGRERKESAYLQETYSRQGFPTRSPCLHYQPLHEFWEGWVLAPPVLVTQVHAVHLWSKGVPLGWLYLLPGAQPTAVSGCGLALSLHTFLRLQHSSKSFQFKDLSPFEDKAL